MISIAQVSSELIESRVYCRFFVQ